MPGILGTREQMNWQSRQLIRISTLSPLSFLKKQIHKYIIEKWNQIWRERDKGSATRNMIFFFQTVGLYDRLASKYLHPNFVLTQFLTGHGKFGKYLHRFHISNNSDYICEEEN